METPPDKYYQYLLVACDPYETIAFKNPNEQIDRDQEKFVTNWDVDAKVLRKIFDFLCCNGWLLLESGTSVIMSNCVIDS